MGSAWKLVGGLVGVVASVARHAVWYVRYQLDGETHDQPEPGTDQRKRRTA